MAQRKKKSSKSDDGRAITVDGQAVRCRVRELRFVERGHLRNHPRNPRRHPDYQRGVLAEVVRRLGFADALIGRELPDGTVQILDGHLRSELVGEGDR
ncbi:MAG: hypothetical protein GXP27_00870, partial [Planctomycetes bacterium]|nr:hypothetical protein [Planctomycetota bacterium]